MNVMRGAQTVVVAEPAGSTGTVNIVAASVAAAVAPGFINAAHVRRRDVASGTLRIPSQAARSICRSMGFVASVCEPSNFPHVDLP